MKSTASHAAVAIVAGGIVPLVFRLLFSILRLNPLASVDFLCQRRANLIEDAHRLSRQVAGTLEHLAEEVVRLVALNAAAFVSLILYIASQGARLTLVC